MHRKVSMVMTCYNKAEYISEMFDSIIAQNWDNLELILVNDGSTDGTYEEISAYEPKFRKRGFEVVIINQENKGVCAAAKAGLECITGDYVCMVDADDELSPVYISTMAGWLEYDSDYDYCVCGATEYTGYDDLKAFGPDKFRGLHYNDDFLIERYLLGTIRPTTWIYMLKKSYFRKCNIVSTFFTTTKGSHEPAYIIPILALGGKYKYIPLPLYHCKVNGESHSRSKQFEKMKQFHDEYNRLCKIAIEQLPDNKADDERKETLIRISFISACIRNYRFATQAEEKDRLINETIYTLVNSINSFFKPEQPITSEQALGSEDALIRCVINALTGKRLHGYKPYGDKGRVIGYGALGRVASRLLPELKGTELEPKVLWDKLGDGNIVAKPEFTSVNPNDLLLIFPKGNVLNEIYGSIRKTNCKIMKSEDISAYISSLRFPQITQFMYEGLCK